jgi:hypothetical protein
MCLRRPRLVLRVRIRKVGSLRRPTSPSGDLSATVLPTDTGLTITAVMFHLGDEKEEPIVCKYTRDVLQ